MVGYGFLSPLGFYQVNIPSQYFLRVLSRNVLAFVVHGRGVGRSSGCVRLCFISPSECSANRMHSFVLRFASVSSSSYALAFRCMSLPRVLLYGSYLVAVSFIRPCLSAHVRLF